MNKTLRIPAMVILALVVTVMNVSGAAFAGSSQQGTVPGTVTYSNGDVTLSTGTGTTKLLVSMIPPGGNANARELAQSQLTSLGAPPPGLKFKGNGLTLWINTASGAPVDFFSASVLVCFPAPAGAAVAIWRWYTAAELQAVGRAATVGAWIYFRSSTSGGQTCTRTRLPGTYAPIGS